jgi:capsular exopolysaccharide synthesis family protein
MEPFAPAQPQILSSWSASFFTRLHRYKSLLRRRWWVLALCVSAGLTWQAWNLATARPEFVSSGQMMVSPRINLPENTSFMEEGAQFFGTQIRLMMAPEVGARARERVRAISPDLPESMAQLDVQQIPKTSIFALGARGPEPRYAQAWLNAVMDEFIRYKDEMRQDTSDKTLASITEQLLRLEKELEQNENEFFAFQKANDVVVIQEQGNTAGQYLVGLEKELADMSKELQLLDMLSLDQRLSDNANNPGPANNPNPGAAPGPDTNASNDSTSAAIAAAGPEQDYLKVRQELQLKKNELQELARVLKPRHPKILNLQEEISQQENLLSIYREQSLQQLKTRREALQIKAANTKNLIAEWSKKALAANETIAEFRRLQANVERTKGTYDRLAEMARSLDMSNSFNQGTIQILQRATPAVEMRQGRIQSLLKGAIVGLILGCGILFLLDRIDDRVNSFTELKDHFEEQVLGQIPWEESATKRLALLQQNDTRQIYSEAFRNIRSSLLYMAIEGERPRVLAVTSAIPGEGKSTIALNLAITMAFAGSRVLIVDADMRKGVLHEDLSTEHTPGLSEVLSRQVAWREVLKRTPYAGLDYIPRGKSAPHVGELLISPAAELFIQEARASYDYVVFDTPPVLAADDTPSLAPKVDGVIMVMRASYTSSRMTQSSLDTLYHRQVNVLGMVFNFIDTNLPDYYHYHYYRSYYTAQDPT